MQPLTTGRTTIREIQLSDAPFIYELMNTPEWLRNIGDRNVKSLDSAKAYIINNIKSSYKENGFGMWLVQITETHKPIGTCGLLQREYLPIPDIGFAFLPEYIGKGFGRESAEAVMHWASENLKTVAIAGFTNPENQASVKLLEKLGFKELRKMTLPNGAEVTYFERSLDS